MNKSLENFSRWKEVFESKTLKINFKKIEVMVSGSKGRVLNSNLIPVPRAARK